MTRFVLISGLLLCVACPSSEGDDEAAGDEGPACGEEVVVKDEVTPTIMEAWGAACMMDSDCEPGLGVGAKCITNILSVFDLPSGYCTRECAIDSTAVTFILDDPECDPAGGVACVGIDGSFTACAPTCENDSQCGREGYACTIMPLIGMDGDPTFCLMNAEACCTAPGSC